MLIRNLLKGMTIPGAVPTSRTQNITKQLSTDEKSLFLIQSLIGEIVRLHKILARIKGPQVTSDIMENINQIDQSAIASAWGLHRSAFAKMIQKIQNRGDLRRKTGSGAPVSVMTDAIKRKLVKILLHHKGDIDFKTWEEEIRKDKRFTVTPHQDTIRRWWINECGGIYVHKKSRPLISEKTARYLLLYSKEYSAPPKMKGNFVPVFSHSWASSQKGGKGHNFS